MLLSCLSPVAPPCRRKRPATPALAVAAGRGVFRPNAAARQLLALTAGELVCVEHDAANPREWYLFKAPALAGYRLECADAGHPNGLLFYAKALRQALMAALPGAGPGPLLFRLAEAPVLVNDMPVWPLLTAPYWHPAPP